MRLEDRGDTFARIHDEYGRGFRYRGHRHYIDHDTVLVQGSVCVRHRLTKDGPVAREERFDAPSRFTVYAGVFHEIEVLTDEARWECVFRKPPEGSPIANLYNQELLD
jgi:hypothetical protein